jgi:hypothetical protein
MADENGVWLLFKLLDTELNLCLESKDIKAFVKLKEAPYNKFVKLFASLSSQQQTRATMNFNDFKCLIG